jgi:hypothetical protein
MSQLVWFIPSGLLAVLLGLMLRNRAYKVCPWFFGYVTFAVAADAARFVALRHTHSYIATYWITEAGYCLLGVLAMRELILLVLGDLSSRWWGRLLLPSALLLGIVLSLAHARSSPPQFGGVSYYIAISEIAVRLVQGLVFVGLVGIVLVRGLRWQQYALGIATGFGGYSLISLLMTLKFSDFGKRFAFLFSVTLLVAYSVAVLTWIWFFSAPQRPDPDLPAPTPEEIKSYLATLNQYREWLRAMRRKRWLCFR